MMATGDGSTLRFGSPLRAGADDSAYQLNRLQLLCEFSLRLLDASRRRLADREREGRHVWRDKEWLKEQRQTWENLANDRERMLAEQAAYVAELEQSKEWLDKQRIAWQETAERIERETEEVRRKGQESFQYTNRLRDQIRDLESTKTWLEDQRRQYQAKVEELEGIVTEMRNWSHEQDQIIKRLEQELAEAVARWWRHPLARVLRGLRLVRNARRK